MCNHHLKFYFDDATYTTHQQPAQQPARMGARQSLVDHIYAGQLGMARQRRGQSSVAFRSGTGRNLWIATLVPGSHGAEVAYNRKLPLIASTIGSAVIPRARTSSFQGGKWRAVGPHLSR